MLKQYAAYCVDAQQLIIFLLCVITNQALLGITTIVVLIIRNEVVRPLMLKKVEVDLDPMQRQLDELSREMSAIKLNKAIRSFN